MSFAIVSVRCAMALLFKGERLGERMILKAACVILMSLLLLEMINMVKEHKEDDVDTLLGAFIDISYVLIKAEFP